jgi:2-methylcitrate dehydratase
MNERQFLHFLESLNRTRPSKSALAEAQIRVADSLACFYGAQNLPAVKKIQAAFSYSKTGPCSVWGQRRTASAEEAVFLNGSAVRALDYNDTYLSKEPCHPSDTLAAIWAAAELAGGPNQGRRVLEALVYSYEVMVRLCDAGSLRSRGWDHVTYLPIASAVGVSHIFGLSAGQTFQAVALALTGSIALRQTRVGSISDWKAACAANAARSGLVGALLARRGMTGPSAIFSGRHGFEKQVSGRLNFSVSGIGKPWGILKTHMKYFPAEHHAQSAIEAGVALHDRIKNKTIQSVTVLAFEAAVSIIGSEKEKWKPSTRETADHSLPYLVAVALQKGDVNLEQYRREMYKQPSVRLLMKKIHIAREPRFDRLYPAAMPTRLIVRLKGGDVFRADVERPKGYAGRPFSAMDLQTKFFRLTRSALSLPRQKKLFSQLVRFDRVSRLSSLKNSLAVR